MIDYLVAITNPEIQILLILFKLCMLIFHCPQTHDLFCLGAKDGHIGNIVAHVQQCSW